MLRVLFPSLAGSFAINATYNMHIAVNFITTSCLLPSFSAKFASNFAFFFFFNESIDILDRKSKGYSSDQKYYLLSKGSTITDIQEGQRKSKSLYRTLSTWSLISILLQMVQMSIYLALAVLWSACPEFANSVEHSTFLKTLIKSTFQKKLLNGDNELSCLDDQKS